MRGGGGGGGGDDMKDDLCPICDQAFHENPSRKYLNCQFPTCGTFQWLSEVIRQSSNSPSMRAHLSKMVALVTKKLGTGGDNVLGGL
ncbi:hypothetical protein GIB67_021683 [Kingdonia uniflora]|uniref:Uncharacterized protein n=1 Tax=Kingdonia uniflora TaxID=39325 RepID=A0A7J7LM19_9MAGN|nr:hypothetical protein GIB67_021683 [Kingdonia uniflora]